MPSEPYQQKSNCIETMLSMPRSLRRKVTATKPLSTNPFKAAQPRSCLMQAQLAVILSDSELRDSSVLQDLAKLVEAKQCRLRGVLGFCAGR